MKFYFKDSGNIFIRLTDKCSANCEGCSLSSLNSSKKIPLHLYDNIEQFIEKKILGKYSISFLGNNILGFYEYDFIKKISFGKNIQLSFDDIVLYDNFIKNLHNENNVNFFIIMTINSVDDIKKFLHYLKSPSKYVSITIVCDLEKYINFFKKIFPKIEEKHFQKFIFNGSKVEVENLSFNFLSKNICKSLKNFEIIDDKIFIKTDLNIGHNGDISFHLNQWCNNSITKISDIFSENILNDFYKFRDFLIENNDKKNRCLECKYYLGKKF